MVAAGGLPDVIADLFMLGGLPTSSRFSPCLSSPQAIQGGLLAFVQWVSQTFIQLMAHVPVLVVPAAC